MFLDLLNNGNVFLCFFYLKTSFAGYKSHGSNLIHIYMKWSSDKNNARQAVLSQDGFGVRVKHFFLADLNHLG